MNNPTTPYCLALYPHSGWLERVKQAAVQTRLESLGLLGGPIPSGDEPRFMLGERFYPLLSFMGCAPALRLEPAEEGDRRFCHFRFVDLVEPRFRFLRPEVKARCPHCRKAGDTAEKIQALVGKQAWTCPHCRQQVALTDINWKHEAGISRYFIELIDVHPHEVVPTDGLLKELTSLTEQKWHYFYTTGMA